MGPTLDADSELRAVVLSHAARLRERYGGRIPAKELSAGVTIRNARVPIWNYQKGIFKPAALGPNGAALSIQTSIESPYADERDAGAGHFVYKYRGTDPDHADNRALRRAMTLRLPLLYLVAIDKGVYDAIVPVYVTTDDPQRFEFTLMADQSTITVGEPETPMAAIRRAYATRAVMQRLHQHQFRRAVLHAYRERCAICTLRHVELLDAAHILEDRHELGEPVVSNGLGLCKIHHSAYDANIIGIDPDTRVHVRVDILNEIDGPMLRYGLQAIHDTALILPKRVSDRPNRAYLAERYERFLAA
jgi:putative restriction endonuclease